MNRTAPNTDADTAALLDVWRRLPSAERGRVYRYAASLLRGDSVSPQTGGSDVVGALRTLVRRYPQVERRRLIARAGELLAQHRLAGRPAPMVIAELEAMFAHEAARAARGIEA